MKNRIEGGGGGGGRSCPQAPVVDVTRIKMKILKTVFKSKSSM